MEAAPAPHEIHDGYHLTTHEHGKQIAATEPAALNLGQSASGLSSSAYSSRPEAQARPSRPTPWDTPAARSDRSNPRRPELAIWSVNRSWRRSGVDYPTRGVGPAKGRGQRSVGEPMASSGLTGTLESPQQLDDPAASRPLGLDPLLLGDFLPGRGPGRYSSIERLGHAARARRRR